VSYAASVTKARAALKKKGAATTLRRISPGTAYDPVTGVWTGPSTATQPIYMVIFPTTRREKDKVIARAQLTISLVPPVVIQPMQGDEVWFSGKWWKLPSVSPLSPDDATPILYEAEVEI
jgi:hypothetical protein